MKNNFITTLIILFISFSSIAQSPQLINYQAVAHDNNGDPILNENLDVRIGIISASVNGAIEWEEEHSVTTNNYGLFSLLIGGGTTTGGGNLNSFSNISWKNNIHFLKVQINAGFGFEDLGIQQLVSVPYALYAKEAESVTSSDSDWTVNNNDMYSGVTGNVGVGSLNPGEKLTLSYDGYLGWEYSSTATNVAHKIGKQPGNAQPLDFETHFNPGPTGPIFRFRELNSTGDVMTILYNGNIGVGVSSPDSKLHISNGTLKIDNGSNPYSLPSSDGATNQVITTDGSGNLTWQSPTVASLGWNITGNSGTNSGTNFIGTTDNQDLSFRVNNLLKLKLTTNGQLEQLNVGQCVLIGEGAGLNLDLSTNIANTLIGYNSGKQITTGSYNTAFGWGSLENNNTGIHNTAIGPDALQLNTVDYNTAVGSFSLQANTSGSSNTALGSLSLFDNVTGSYNVGIGRGSLQGNTTGNNNIALGYASGSINTTGNNNTYIGYFANAVDPTLTNATAIGANATVSLSNSLILGDNANVGIGTSSPSQKLDVIGDITANDYHYNSAQVHYLTLSGMSFRPGHNTTNNWAGYWGQGAAYLTSETGNMQAKFHLPDGAVINNIEYRYEDDAIENLILSVSSHSIGGGSSILSTLTTSTNSSGVQIYNDAVSINVNNNGNTYYARAYANTWSDQSIDNKLQFYGVIITYEVIKP